MDHSVRMPIVTAYWHPSTALADHSPFPNDRSWLLAKCIILHPFPQRMFEESPQMQGLRGPSPDVPGNRPNSIQPHARSIGEITTFQTPSKPSSGLPGMIRSLMSSWGARRSASTLAKVGETFPLSISSEPCKSSRHILLIQQTHCNRQLQHNVCSMVFPDDAYGNG